MNSVVRSGAMASVKTSQPSQCNQRSKESTMADISRRTWLKGIAITAVAVPLAGVATQASAAKNDASRKALQYQDTPKNGNNCAGCMQFVPGKDAKSPGGCKVIPGDNEISPNGWCAAWVKKA
jgi:hypothetical protein